MAADRVIRWTTAGAVVGVAAVAAVASYEHAYALVQAHGEAVRTGRLVPLTVDGLIYASSMVMLDSARRKMPAPALARWLLGLGIAATLAANVVHGLGHGPAGAVVAAWPAVALVGSYELLMVIIRSAQAPAGAAPGAGACGASGDDPFQTRAAEEFAGEVAAGRVPSVRLIRARLHVGQPRAQRVRGICPRLATRVHECADWLIGWPTAPAVVGVTVAAVVSHEPVDIARLDQASDPPGQRTVQPLQRLSRRDRQR